MFSGLGVWDEQRRSLVLWRAYDLDDGPEQRLKEVLKDRLLGNRKRLDQLFLCPLEDNNTTLLSLPSTDGAVVVAVINNKANISAVIYLLRGLLDGQQLNDVERNAVSYYAVLNEMITPLGTPDICPAASEPTRIRKREMIKQALKPSAIIHRARGKKVTTKLILQESISSVFLTEGGAEAHLVGALIAADGADGEDIHTSIEKIGHLDQVAINGIKRGDYRYSFNARSKMPLMRFTLRPLATLPFTISPNLTISASRVVLDLGIETFFPSSKVATNVTCKIPVPRRITDWRLDSLTQGSCRFVDADNNLLWDLGKVRGQTPHKLKVTFDRLAGPGTRQRVSLSFAIWDHSLSGVKIADSTPVVLSQASYEASVVY